MFGRAEMKQNMIALTTLRELYEYNYWARDRQLDTCFKLEEEKFLCPMGSSFSSLRDTVVHLLGAEWIWLERFCGRSPRSMPSWLDQLRTCRSIAQHWENVELGMRSYLAQVNSEALNGPLSYVNLQGLGWTYPLWRALLHLVNHQTYHRGQVSTLLRQLGATPVSVDFLVYFDLSESKTSGDQPH
jgi:uncharacterized damage-inducible protein DinB